MTHDTQKQSYRGVRCLSCQQPIPLPPILASADLARGDQQSNYSLDPHNRVFSIRCRACEKEKLYRTSDVADFEGMPKPRVSHARATHIADRRAAGLSRAANG